MKWLIFILLFSCGKHQEPKALDYSDSDGDQIQDYQESEFSRYVADFETLGLVKGVIQFNIDKLIEIPFSNVSELQQKTMALMVRDEKRFNEEDYFSEWSRINLKTKYQLSSPKLKQYPIHIKFSAGSDKANEVVLVNGKEITSLGNWDELNNVKVDVNDLRSLLEGKSYLALRKSFKNNPIFRRDSQLTIKEKTYRVYYFDGKKTKVLYVSRKLSMDELLKHLKIDNLFTISDDELFFNAHKRDLDKWYGRELSSGDKILAFTNVEELRHEFLKNFNYQKKVVSRKNGHPVSGFKLDLNPEARVYLRIKSLQFVNRTFKETAEKRSHGTGGGVNGDASRYSCTHYLRNIQKEQVGYAGLDFLYDNLVASEILNSATVMEQIDESGSYWEMKLNSSSKKLNISLNPLPPSTYVITGEYRNSCGTEANRGRYPSFSTNKEGKFSFEVESFVEKIE